MPNPKTEALDAILFNWDREAETWPARQLVIRARAELAALRSRPSEKSVEECVDVYNAAWRAAMPHMGMGYAMTTPGEQAGIAAVRAFLLDEEAGRVEEER